ncbi:LysR substrate-binding domain-containing protein [Oryzomicrobium sp.]|uniref:LysR substrate-binding domain-containing protein n=1 Tax=Oryzomicrobium sp. TaxID=1911578 RepID=UPI0025E3C6A1|nr:LysR substrate-binding domain-containing protein [Oryzomicrobium sp.]MCE1242246.1 LysR substrate-binding domain-containing protein [Oryzomicrobium sp.]
MLTLTDMRYLVALARERHFGRAAATCRVSQPTLSVAIKKVEERLGVLLFERNATEIRITEVGQRLVDQAERVLAEALKLEELANQGKDPLKGPLRLGVIYTIAPYLLPPLIPALHERAPEMPLFLKEDFTGHLIPALKRGELDVIVIALPVGAPFNEPGLVAQPVYDEPFRVVVPADHPWATRESVGRGELSGEHLLLLGQGNCFRDQVLEACPHGTGEGGEGGTLEGSSLETIRHMVASGAGVAVMPSTAADPLRDKEPLVKVLPFAEDVAGAGAEAFRRVGLVWRVTFPRPPALDAVKAAVLACVSQGLPGAAPVRS